MQYKLQQEQLHPNASVRKIHIDNGIISEHAHNPEYIWSCYDSLTQALIFLETIFIFLSLICHKKTNLKTKNTLWNISIKEMHSSSSNTNLISKKQHKKLHAYKVNWCRNTSCITTYWTQKYQLLWELRCLYTGRPANANVL